MKLEIGGMYYNGPSVISPKESRVIITDIDQDYVMVKYRNLEDLEKEEMAMTTKYFTHHFQRLEDAPVWDRVKFND